MVNSFIAPCRFPCEEYPDDPLKCVLKGTVIVAAATIAAAAVIVDISTKPKEGEEDKRLEKYRKIEKCAKRVIKAIDGMKTIPVVY